MGIFFALLILLLVMKSRKRGYRSQNKNGKQQGKHYGKGKGKGKSRTKKRVQSRGRIGSKSLNNIYGNPLAPCQTLSNDSRGSWDPQGYCSERGGGVHQICMKIDEQTKNFARDTMQGSNWSEGRQGKNHCMCLGAWSLYKSRQSNDAHQTENELVCEAIPEMALSEEYTNHWNTWNGHEQPDQIVDGINSLVSQCYNRKRSPYLKKKYCDLTRRNPKFKSSKTYQKIC